MLRPNQTPSDALLARIYNVVGSEPQSPQNDAARAAQCARIRRERVRRMLVHSFFAGSAQ